MKILGYILAVALFWGAIFFPDAVSAQFSLSSIGEDGPAFSQKIEVEKTYIPIDVENDARRRANRILEWRRHNTIDTRVSLTGILTEYNKYWTNNNSSSLSLELAAYYYHTYAKNRHSSTFKFDAIYGFNNYFGDSWFKNQDMFKIYYLATWKFKMTGFWKDWSYGASTDFTSQFQEGYEKLGTTDVWSNFMAPGTVNLGVGITYTSSDPKLPFVVTLNPASGNAIFVLDDRIADPRRSKLLGLRSGYMSDGTPIVRKIEGGSSLNVGFNRTFLFGPRKRVSLQYNTTLNSFYGWITQVSRPHASGQPTIFPTVTWNNSLTFSPVRFFLIEFRHVLKYDRSQIDKVQMQYYLRVGLTYRFLNKK